MRRFLKKNKSFRHSIFDVILVVCPSILCGSCGSILVPVRVRECTTIMPFVQLHARNDLWCLDKAFVPIRKQGFKRKWRKIAFTFFWKYVGPRSLAQFLWYARPSYVGVAPGFLFLWVIVGALLSFFLSNYQPETTSDDLDKALVPIRNQLFKIRQKNCVGFFWKYF